MRKYDAGNMIDQKIERHDMTNKSLKELLDSEHWAMRAVQIASGHVQLKQRELDNRYMRYETEKNQHDYMTNPRYQEYVDDLFAQDSAYHASAYLLACEELDAKTNELKAVRKELKSYFAMIMAIDTDIIDHETRQI